MHQHSDQLQPAAKRVIDEAGGVARHQQPPNKLQKRSDFLESALGAQVGRAAPALDEKGRPLATVADVLDEKGKVLRRTEPIEQQIRKLEKELAAKREEISDRQARIVALSREISSAENGMPMEE